MLQIRKGSQGGRSQSALVDFAFDRQKRAALHPALSKFSVAGQAQWVIRGLQILVRAPDVVPMLLEECHITARGHIVIHGQDEQWSCVGGSISVREILNPRHQCGRLRDFVFHFAIVALIFENQLQGSTGGGKIPDGIEREICPKRVASEKPGKTRPLTESGSAVSGNQATA